MLQAAKISLQNSNQVLALLPETVRREILQLGKTVRVDHEDSIYNFGDAVKYLYFPSDAVFSTTSLMEDGSSAEISLTGCEGIVGVFSAFNEQTSRYWTSVLIGGEALKVEVAAIRSLIAESEALSTALLQAYRNLTAQISQRAVCNGRHSLAERFCCWLLLVQKCANSNELPLTHETIAKKLGARRAGITNVAGTSQTAEAISYSRGTITILDRARLEKMSCECYGTIQSQISYRS